MTAAVGDNQVKSWAASLAELEDQMEALSEAKRDLYGTIRKDHGKQAAASLKLALRLSRMDADKIAEREEIDAEAERMLALIESRAPRATRASAVPKSETIAQPVVKAQQKALPAPKPKAEVLPPVKPNGVTGSWKDALAPLDKFR